MSEERRSVYEAHQSERAIAGAILSGVLSVQEVDLAPGDFTDLIASHVFGQMCALDAQGKPCDLATVSDALPDTDLKALVEMMGETRIVSSASAGPYIASVKTASMRRALSKVAQNTAALAGNADEDPMDTAEEIRRQIDELVKNGPSQDALGMEDVIMRLHEWLFDQPDDAVCTGIAPLDALLGGGIRGSKLCIIGARPSVGKSALGQYIAQNAARDGKRVLLVSLEMDEKEIAARMLARQTHIPVDAIESRRLTPQQQGEVVGAYGDLSTLPLSIDTEATTPGKILSLALRMRAKQGLDLIVVDYLQLLQSGRKTNSRTEEVGYISRQLKLMAMKLKIPVVAMTQMNRESEKGTAEGGRPPKMSESRESGSIEQDANQFLILHPPSRAALSESHARMYDACEANGWTFMHVIVSKNRNGKKGLVPVAFDAANMRFLPFEREGAGAQRGGGSA